MSEQLATVLESELSPIRCCLEVIIRELTNANRHASIRNALHVMSVADTEDMATKEVIDQVEYLRPRIAELK